ncbi:MAG: hypothetical protein HQL65_10185 [Magnetococcales bacterium]|nr:hypothetical protein [Magnetococcales bacterium]
MSGQQATLPCRNFFGQSAQPLSRVGWYINHDPERFLLACIPAGEPREIVREALRRCGLAVSRQ